MYEQTERDPSVRRFRLSESFIDNYRDRDNTDKEQAQKGLTIKSGVGKYNSGAPA